MKIKKTLPTLLLSKFTLFFAVVFVMVATPVLVFHSSAQDKSKEKITVSVSRERGEMRVPTAEEIADSKKGIEDRIVKKMADVNVPVEITKLKVKGKTADFDKPLKTDDNWVDGLSVEIKNVSNRQIIYAYLKLNFPVDDSYNRFLSVALEYGKQPTNGDEASTVNPLQPGEIATLTVKNEIAAELTRRLQRESAGRFLKKNQARLYVDQVWFDANTMWTAGDTIFTRDRTDKKKWVRGVQTSSVSPKKERELHFARAAYNKTNSSLTQCYTAITETNIACCVDFTYRTTGSPTSNGYSSVQESKICDPPDCAQSFWYDSPMPGCSSGGGGGGGGVTITYCVYTYESRDGGRTWELISVDCGGGGGLLNY